MCINKLEKHINYKFKNIALLEEALTHSSFKKNQYKIQILNLAGKEINELSNKEFEVGNHSLFWNGNDNLGYKVSSGVYIVKVSGSKVSMQNKVVLLK